MLPEAAISHSAPGRTRFRVASKRREAAYYAKLAEHLQRLNGVGQVDVNPVTGSVLVHHQLPLDQLVERVHEESLFQVKDGPPQHLRDILRERFSSFNDGISRLTESRLDLEDLALSVLIVVGLRQMLAGQIATPALTAFWYAAALLSASEKVRA